MSDLRWHVNGKRQIDVRVTQRRKEIEHTVSLQSSLRKVHVLCGRVDFRFPYYRIAWCNIYEQFEMTGSGVVTKRLREMMMGGIVFLRKILWSHSAQHCTVSPVKRQLRIAVYAIVLSSVFELTNTV
jgi:hypothetical protein